MNSQEKNELIWLRSRSSSAVIKKGYRFYLNNFRKLNLDFPAARETFG